MSLTSPGVLVFLRTSNALLLGSSMFTDRKRQVAARLSLCTVDYTVHWDDRGRRPRCRCPNDLTLLTSISHPATSTTILLPQPPPPVIHQLFTLCLNKSLLTGFSTISKHSIIAVTIASSPDRIGTSCDGQGRQWERKPEAEEPCYRLSPKLNINLCFGSRWGG